MICLHFLCLSNPKFMSLPAPCFSLSLSLCSCCQFLMEYLSTQPLITFIYLFKSPLQVSSRKISQTPIFPSLQNICVSPSCSNDDLSIYVCLLHYINKSLNTGHFIQSISKSVCSSFNYNHNPTTCYSWYHPGPSLHHFSPSLPQQLSYLLSLVHNIPLQHHNQRDPF